LGMRAIPAKAGSIVGEIRENFSGNPINSGPR
jgi:hypothetical protein